MAKRQPASGLNQPFQDIFPAPVVAARAPTSGDTRYEVGQQWVDTSSDQIYGLAKVASGAATWSILGPGASDVDTLTGDTGGALSPTLGNINILGGTGVEVAGAGSTLTINTSTGYASITEYVVDAGGSGDYTTIQAALNAANAAGGGIVVLRPGTYTEDLTCYDNTQVVGVGFGDTGDYIIQGTHTPPATGGFVFRNVRLTDATAIFSSAVAGSAHLITGDVEVGVTNGHMFDLANWTGKIECWDVNPFLGTNDGFLNNTGGATVAVYSAGVGVGTGQSATISGTFDSLGGQFSCPMTITTGATATNLSHCNFAGPVTLAGNSAGVIYNSNITGGASAALTMSSSANWTVGSTVLSSSNSPCLDGAGAGTLTISSVEFVDNAEVAATLTTSLQEHLTGTSLATTFDTNVAAAGVTLAGTTLAADGTDANIGIAITPKGSGAVAVVGAVDITGDLDVDNLNLNGNSIISTDVDGDITLAPNGTGTTTVSNGGILVSGGDVINTHSDAGTDVTVEVTNSDNTNLASRAGFEVATGGASGGDPYVNFLISGGQTFTMGIDNSTANDDFVISDSAALGTTNRISIDGSSGDVSVLGNLSLPTAATQLQVEGGAVTDFIGQATLVLGTVTVANTNIAAGDRIFVTRNSVAASTALGSFVTAITPATSFTITAAQPGTPGSAETGDVSIVDYFIVRSL